MSISFCCAIFKGSDLRSKHFSSFWEGCNALFLCFWPVSFCCGAHQILTQASMLTGPGLWRWKETEPTNTGLCHFWQRIGVAYLDFVHSLLSSPGRIQRSDAQRPQVPAHPPMHDTPCTRDILGTHRSITSSMESTIRAAIRWLTIVTIITIPSRNSRTQKNSGA